MKANQISFVFSRKTLPYITTLAKIMCFTHGTYLFAHPKNKQKISSKVSTTHNMHREKLVRAKYNKILIITDYT
jgi:hypothetical protein